MNTFLCTYFEIFYFLCVPYSISNGDVYPKAFPSIIRWDDLTTHQTSWWVSFPRLRIFDWNMLNRCTVNEAQAHRWIEQSLRIFIHDEVILAELLLGAAPLAAFTMSDHHPKRIWTLKNLSQVTMLFSQKWPYLKEKWGGVPSTLTVTHCAKLTKIVLFAKWDGCTVANQLLSQSQVQIN